jgi:hypothetical protein
VKLEPPEVPLDLPEDNSIRVQSAKDKATEFTVEKQLRELETIRKDIDQTVGSVPEKKQGFFAKLFSKNKENTPQSASTADEAKNSISENINLPALPDLPPIDMPSETKERPKGRKDSSVKKPKTSSKVSIPLAKEQKKPYSIDLPEMDISTIDTDIFMRSEEHQSRFSHIPSLDDTNEMPHFSLNNGITSKSTAFSELKSNVNDLISQADIHLEEKKRITAPNALLSEPKEPKPMPSFESPSIPDSHVELNSQLHGATEAQQGEIPKFVVPEMPTSVSTGSKGLTAVEKEHEKLRKRLQSKITNPDSYIDKKELMELFKKYDERIERKIEDKELWISDKSKKVERFHDLLMKKEREVKQLHAHLKKTDSILRSKESDINSIINAHVENQLAQRLREEKSLLRKEIMDTKSLNLKLKKKLDILEKDRAMFERKSKKLLAEEQAKLSAGQALYDKKIREVSEEKKKFMEEKKMFEQRRQASLQLLSQGDTIAKELAELEHVKGYVEKARSRIRRELTEDRELKHAIQKAEQRITREKKNLDNMVFSKYIESKLKSIVPDTIAKDIILPDSSLNPEAIRIYNMIENCKSMLSQNIPQAKREYNHIKRLYENGRFDKYDRAMIFNALRYLYNDIQLATIGENRTIGNM